MLKSIFIIFLFQLIGESVQKYFEITIPGPVIGLILLLFTFILLKRSTSIFIKKTKEEISSTSTYIIVTYLCCLFLLGLGW